MKIVIENADENDFNELAQLARIGRIHTFYLTDEDEGSQGVWIPVSERLPEEHGYYLVTTDGSHNAVIDIAEYGKFYRKPENEYVLEWNKASRVIAWRPLPEPYEKGDTE